MWNLWVDIVDKVMNSLFWTSSNIGLLHVWLQEGRELDTLDRDADRSSSADSGQIFLIDLEEVQSQEPGKTMLKPSSKKFSASALAQNVLSLTIAQNWLFRNKDQEEETDNLVTTEDEDEESTSRKNSRGEKLSESEGSPAKKPILSKLMNIVDKNKSKHREMNFWQPQGT